MIRRLGASDVAAYRAMRLDALRLHPSAFSSSFEEEGAYAPDDLLRFVTPPGITFGAFQGDTLVGIAGLFVQPRLKQRHKGTLVGVYVEAGHRGAGSARGLVEAVIAEARHIKLRELQLSVTVGNDGAKRLYSSLGFHTYGIERRALLIDGRFYDDELMALALDG